MSEEEKYLSLLRAITRKQESLLGEKVAEGKARSAPLEIDPEGKIKRYYGEGEKAVELLIKQYEDVWGKEAADKKVKRVVRKELDSEDYGLVPERVKPEEKESEDLWIFNKVKKAIS